MIFKGEIDVNVAGKYELIVTNSNLVKKVYVTVKKDQTSLEVQDIEVFEGDYYKHDLHLISATDKDGKQMTMNELIVKGTVDLTLEGDYVIEIINGIISKKVKITVRRFKNDENSLPQTGIYSNIQFISMIFGTIGIILIMKKENK